MMLKEKDIITLDDGKKYLIISIIKNEEEEYAILSNLNNVKEIKIVKNRCIDGRNIMERVEDEKILKNIFIELYKKERGEGI